MLPSHPRDQDLASTPDDGSEQLGVPQGTYRRLLTSALGVMQNVYHSIATRPPTPSPGIVSEGYGESSDCVEYSRECRRRLSYAGNAQPMH